MADDLHLLTHHRRPGVLLQRRGVVVPYRTLHRFSAERCAFGPKASTVRVADGEPGAECQLDFRNVGMLADPVTGGRGALTEQ